MVANPKLVPDNDTVACGLLYHSPAEESHIGTTAPREQVTSTVPQTPASNHTFIRKTMGNRGLQEEIWTSSVSHGETQQHLVMKGYSDSGKPIASKGVLIPLLQM